jgi:P27 family predicted phage terminase small subunit
MARKPRPSHLKKLEGKPTNQNKDIPTGEPYQPQAPEWLSSRAKAYFRQFAKDLYNLGVITKPDRYELAMLANLYDQYITIQEEIEQEGTTWTEIDTAGNQKEKLNPKISASLSLAKQVSSLLADFGLSPSDRETVSKASKREESSNDPLEQHLKN